MQRLDQMNLIGLLRTPETSRVLKTPPVPENPALHPAKALLTLAQAQQIMTSAALGTNPDRRVPTVQRPSAPVTSAGVRRTPPRSAADTSTTASEVPPQAKRDKDGAVQITEKQANGYLPNGRYRVRHFDGRTTTIEIGSEWCAEGLRLVRTRKGDEAAQRRIEKEKAIQDLLLGEVR
jgi:hypothetical protein